MLRDSVCHAVYFLGAKFRSQEVPAEWKRTPNSTHASDCDVLVEIWVTRGLLHATACHAALHIKGHQDKKTAYELLPLPA